MQGIIINPKSEVLRLGSASFRRLPLWTNSYEITVQICEMIDKHPQKDSEIMRQLSRAALKVPSTLAKCTGYKLGKNYIRNLRQSCIATRELSMILLFCYELNHINAEQFAGYNSKIAVLSRNLFRHTKRCENRLRTKRKPVNKK